MQMLVRSELTPVSSIYELCSVPVMGDKAKALANDLSIKICRDFRMLVGEIVDCKETGKRGVYRIDVL